MRTGGEKVLVGHGMELSRELRSWGLGRAEGTHTIVVKSRLFMSEKRKLGVKECEEEGYK